MGNCTRPPAPAQAHGWTQALRTQAHQKPRATRAEEQPHSGAHLTCGGMQVSQGRPAAGPLLPVLTALGAATEPSPQRAQRRHSLATCNQPESHTSTRGSGAGQRGHGAPVPPREKSAPVSLTSPWLWEEVHHKPPFRSLSEGLPLGGWLWNGACLGVPLPASSSPKQAGKKERPLHNSGLFLQHPRAAWAPRPQS